MEIDDFIKTEHINVSKNKTTNFNQNIKPPFSATLLSFFAWIIFIVIALGFSIGSITTPMSPILRIAFFVLGILVALATTVILFAFSDLVKSAYYLAKKEGMK